MNDQSTHTSTEMQSVVVERNMPHAPEKVWRVLTQPEYIEEWLQKNNFRPQIDHRFELDFEWGVVECQVRMIEPYSRLSYTWVSGELESVVTWTLTSTDTGTRLHMEQSGFKPGQPRFYHGARAGWPRFLESIEEVLNRMN